MPSHFIQYIPRHVRGVGQPMGAEHQELAVGFDRPRFHFTGSTTGIVKQIRPGDTIWLVGQLASPWRKLPPSLDARIDVASCHAASDGYTFMAAETSRWFPLADASALLPGLTTERQDGRVTPLAQNPKASIGLVLQQLRRLHDAQPLLQWAADLDARGYDFVSYRLKDGTHKAFDTVVALLKKKKAVFWDRWSLPRQLAEYNHQADMATLRAYLKQMIERANHTWGIPSDAYAQKRSFSAYERAVARKLGRFSNWSAPDSEA